MPPEVDLSTIKGVPTAIFSGLKDNLASVEDGRWAQSLMDPETLVHYGEYELGHLSFLAAKDMSYFEDAMALLKKYHPL